MGIKTTKFRQINIYLKQFYPRILSFQEKVNGFDINYEVSNYDIIEK